MANFIPQEYLKRQFEQNPISHIGLISSIKGYCIQFAKNTLEILKAIQYIEERYDELYVEDDGKYDEIKFNDNTMWDDDYIAELLARLTNNFSKKRFEHVIDVLKFRYNDSEVGITDSGLTSNENIIKKTSNQMVYTLAGAGLGLAVGAGAGLILGKIFVGAVVGSVGVGILGYLIGKNKEKK